MAWRRHLILFVALVCSGLQIVSAVHFLVVRHAVCAEHGELVHGDERHDGGSDGGLLAVGAPGPMPPALARVDSLEEGHEHDHCVLVAAKLPMVTLRGTVRVEAIGHAPVRAVAVPALVLSAGCTPLDRLLLLAPKNSPPSSLASRDARRA